MLIQKQYIVNLASKGERIDGRGSNDYRKIVIEKNPIRKAEGSARVKIGDTEVIAGVKMSVGQPFPDKPDEGVLIVGAEFSPLASPDFETGPPGEDAIELARVVDRGIRESEAIDMKKLCIEEGEKVWIINVDIQILNHAGNLIDASALAAIQALLCTKIPEYDGERVNYEKKGTQKLPINFRPVAVTITKIGENFFIDPSLEEEEVMGTKFVITSRDDGNICALQKSGSEALSVEEIEKALDIAIKKGNDLRGLLS
ncbi:MAG TPA: exosome complex protein Rrp42 [Candidatus Aenigmarchaeota archaeon]|nr:exosome complex protein Rrp42 [Candidatus Aenigmarchaeota archaeon]